MPYSYLSHLRCSKTGEIVDADQPQQLSAVGAPAGQLRPRGPEAGLAPAALLGRPTSLWRYHELLPVRDPAQVVTLGKASPAVAAAAPRQAGRHSGSLDEG
ncbi:hypothetical protein H2136_16990 [Aeromonas hydrophila]|uniref:Uncharacterized protein n=1 Tax=Aeromonas hydrophila TaxID=644 RepID=A0A926FLL1_AERHY|nr:hypothetical protein [Aeromonas hydrophila]